MVKDRSQMVKMGVIKDDFAKANMTFFSENLDQENPDSFALMMSPFDQWFDIINDNV